MAFFIIKTRRMKQFIRNEQRHPMKNKIDANTTLLKDEIIKIRINHMCTFVLLSVC